MEEGVVGRLGWGEGKGKGESEGVEGRYRHKCGLTSSHHVANSTFCVRE